MRLYQNKLKISLKLILHIFDTREQVITQFNSTLHGYKDTQIFDILKFIIII